MNGFPGFDAVGLADQNEQGFYYSWEQQTKLALGRDRQRASTFDSAPMTTTGHLKHPIRRRRMEAAPRSTQTHRHRSDRIRPLGLRHSSIRQLRARTHVSACSWTRRKKGGRHITQTRRFLSRTRRSLLRVPDQVASSAMKRLSRLSPSSPNSMTSRVTRCDAVSGQKME